jgi:hypothetical protein
MGRRARRSALLLSALAVAGCGLLPGSGPAVRLENMSKSPAAVDVNGTWAGTYAGSTSGDVLLGRFGQPPYIVTARLPDGLVVAQLDITAADVEAGSDAAGSVWGQAELSCGTIRLSYGQPSEPLPAVDLTELPPCS